MLLENLSYPEVESYLKERDSILVPVGSVEQHSPYGLIGTDFITAEHIARQTGQAMSVLVAPTLHYGISPHHMAFKGTLTLTPDTFMDVVCDLVRSLVTHGFRRIVFINGHGGNESALQTAFARLKSELLQGMFFAVSWYRQPEVADLAKAYYGELEGDHATPSEVAITRFLRPDSFAGKGKGPTNVEQPQFSWPLTAEDMRRVFPDGRMLSAPWLATAEHGEEIAKTAVAAIEKKIAAWTALEI